MRVLLRLFMLVIVLNGSMTTDMYAQDEDAAQVEESAPIKAEEETKEVVVEEPKEEDAPEEEEPKAEVAPEQAEKEVAEEPKEEAAPAEEEPKVEVAPEQAEKEVAEEPKEEDAPEEEEPKAEVAPEQAEKEVAEDPKEEAAPAEEEPKVEVAPEQAEKEVAEEPKEEAAPAEEEPKVEVAPEQAEKELPPLKEPLGIDTVELQEPQGNWLFKRIWWERAEERYEKIRTLVEKIWNSRMNFFIKRSELDKTVLDPFYIAIGLGQGELKIILDDLINRMEQERQEEGMLSEQERTFFTTLQVEQETLRQLRLDVESISELDHAIDEALIKLMETINRVREQERQSWDQFKEIARVLSEKKARELFYQMDVAWRNIKSMSAYLEKEFADHFKQLTERAEEHVERVKKEIQALKEKGVDFKKQADRIESQEEEQEQVQRETELVEQEEEEVLVQQGWFGSIVISVIDGLKTSLNAVISVVRWPYDLLFGGKAPEAEQQG